MWTLSCDMCNIVPWPGIEPKPPALRVWSLSHLITREVPFGKYFQCLSLFQHLSSWHLIKVSETSLIASYSLFQSSVFVFSFDLPWIHTSFPLLCWNLQLLSINCPSSFHLGNFLLFYHQRYPINFIVKVTDKAHYTTCPRILVPLWDSTYIRGVEAQGNPLAAILFKKKKKKKNLILSFFLYLPIFLA